MKAEDIPTRIEIPLTRIAVKDFQSQDLNQTQTIQETMEIGDINHPLHIEIILTITTILEKETIATTETTPRIEVDYQITDPIPMDETTTTIETDPNPKAETKVEVPDPTPNEGATAD